MITNKTLTIPQLIDQIKLYGNTNENVGLITGCFDIMHIGHVNFLRFAKKKVDKLIVGVDSDENVRFIKGDTRPIHTTLERITFLSELSSVDHLFINEGPLSHDVTISNNYFNTLYNKLQPNYIITAPQFDMFAENKNEIAKRLGIEFLPYKHPSRPVSTTSILKHLELELV